jgi:uncharacterized protein YfeS
MNVNNEKEHTRGEEAQRDLFDITGGHETVRRESANDGNQQERSNRANSTRTSTLGQTSVVGGIIRQLIDASYQELAEKTNQINQLDQDKKRIDLEKQRLKIEREKIQAKIQDFFSLQEELESQAQPIE